MLQYREPQHGDPLLPSGKWKGRLCFQFMEKPFWLREDCYDGAFRLHPLFLSPHCHSSHGLSPLALLSHAAHTRTAQKLQFGARREFKNANSVRQRPARGLLLRESVFLKICAFSWLTLVWAITIARINYTFRRVMH